MTITGLDHPALVSLDRAAEYLDVSPRTVRRRIAEGELPAYQLRGTRAIRVRFNDLENLLRAIPTASPSEAVTRGVA